MASVEGTRRARYSKRLPSLAQALEQREVVDVELLAEEPGDLGRLVLGQLRVTDHHQPVDGGRERLAVAVEDVAALGRQYDVDRALGGRHRGVGAGVEALQLHQPGPEQREHHGDQHEPDAEPDLRRAHAGCRA